MGSSRGWNGVVWKEPAPARALELWAGSASKSGEHRGSSSCSILVNLFCSGYVDLASFFFFFF